MINVAIVGASGLVGQKIIEILIEEKLMDKINLTLFVSEKSAGQTVKICGSEFEYVLLTKTEANKKQDVVFFSAGDEISKTWAKKFLKNGAFVIDNTNAFRRDKNVPLIVPEINKNEIKNARLIANPNCSTIQMVVVLDVLKKLSKINRVVVSTYQSVSGAGKEALNDLENKTKNKIVEGINNNVIPKIGEIDSTGFSVEENKIMFETNKILNDNIEVIATAVRVPVPFCHAESVFVEFERSVNIKEIKQALRAEHIKFSDNGIFLPSECVGSNLTYVCRLRSCSPNSVAFFVVADNLRRGASYNAVKIFEHIIYSKLQNKL